MTHWTGVDGREYTAQYLAQDDHVGRDPREFKLKLNQRARRVADDYLVELANGPWAEGETSD